MPVQLVGSSLRLSSQSGSGSISRQPEADITTQMEDGNSQVVMLARRHRVAKEVGGHQRSSCLSQTQG